MPLQVVGRNLWSDGGVEIKGNSGPSSDVLVEALPRARCAVLVLRP
jgi:hypothetical protein